GRIPVGLPAACRIIPMDFTGLDVGEPQGAVALDPHRPLAEIGFDVPDQCRFVRHAGSTTGVRRRFNRYTTTRPATLLVHSSRSAENHVPLSDKNRIGPGADLDRGDGSQ